MLDSALHGQATIEYDVDERGIGQDIGDGSKGRKLAQRVASEGGIGLDKAFQTQVLKGCSGHDDKGDLHKLSSEK